MDARRGGPGYKKGVRGQVQRRESCVLAGMFFLLSNEIFTEGFRGAAGVSNSTESQAMGINSDWQRSRNMLASTNANAKRNSNFSHTFLTILKRRLQRIEPLNLTFNFPVSYRL